MYYPHPTSQIDKSFTKERGQKYEEKVYDGAAYFLCIDGHSL
jgi:hypothetical protein